jgi:3-hydroxybutyryl-CoA dehydratase
LTGLFLEDLSLGQSAEREWTVSEATIAAFAEVSGDANPVHLDEDYAAGTAFKGRIAHGMLAGSYISAVIGMQLPGPGTIYLSQALKFRRPVRIGDRVLARVSVTAIDEGKAHVTLSTLCSVNGKAVVEGEAVVMVSRRGA